MSKITHVLKITNFNRKHILDSFKYILEDIKKIDKYCILENKKNLINCVKQYKLLVHFK
uniref:Uncharacterized protein n=1 Tax=viral metagenome TaxID=1070528 RepID=A0A6C0ADK1_9ZZZZ